jgi:hypothetical protein
VARVRLDRQATSISMLVALGVRADGQKVLLAIKNMGGESEAAWQPLLDNLVARGLRTPELVIVNGGSGLDPPPSAMLARPEPLRPECGHSLFHPRSRAPPPEKMWSHPRTSPERRRAKGEPFAHARFRRSGTDGRHRHAH